MGYKNPNNNNNNNNSNNNNNNNKYFISNENLMFVNKTNIYNNK